MICLVNLDDFFTIVCTGFHEGYGFHHIRSHFTELLPKLYDDEMICSELLPIVYDDEIPNLSYCPCQ